MSEQEHERPLTRRELRLREQAESEGVESIDDLLNSGDPSTSEDSPAPQAPEGADIEVEIDPLNPDGTPRTRREMRELRAAAIAELLGETGGDADDDTHGAPDAAAPDHTDPEGSDPGAVAAEPDSYGAPTEALRLEDLPVNGGPDDADASEVELDAPTEAFTLEDILDAAEPTAPTGDADAVANLFAGDEDEHDSDYVGSDSPHSDGPHSDADEDPAAESAPEGADDAVDPGAEPETVFVVDEAGDAVEELEVVEVGTEAPAESDEAVAAELIEEDLAASATGGESPGAVPGGPEAEDDDAEADEEDTSTDTAGYSFPDIKPPEEWRSVFDDPSRAASITAPGDSGDFDDLISRAVAQEGSTGGTGASALILPSHPGDTGGLAGPLGATGELFVTGSIELPKSMGETGGHSGIHDSIDYDPFLTGESGEAIGSVTESGPMPVSALSAVSARRRPEVPVVAEPTKDRSKMPLILALSGGGLIVVVIGGVVFAASQGLFG